MGTVASTRGQVKDNAAANVIPDAAAVPSVHSDLLKLANALEPKVVMRIPTMASVSTLAPYEIGMIVTTTTSPTEVWVYVAPGTWTKVWPTSYNGTAVPSAGLGVDNDVYIQY